MQHLKALAIAAPDGALSAAFLITWISPTTLGVERIAQGGLIVLLEFFVIHSSAFMGFVAMTKLPWLKKVGAIIGLGLMYSTFLLVFSLAFGTWWPLWSFWLLIANRMMPVLLGNNVSEIENAAVMAGWGISVLLYLFAVFVTVLLPLPRFGITEAVMEAHPIPGSGVWVDEPQRIIAAGFIYFAGQAAWEYYTCLLRAKLEQGQ